MDDRYFCDINDVHNLILKSTGKLVDPIYFNTIIELSRKMIGSSAKYVLNQEWMDFTTFLFLVGELKDWYKISLEDTANFIDQKYREKYAVSKNEILNIISKAMEDSPENKISKSGRRENKDEHNVEKEPDIQATRTTEKDMYKVVQNALKKGMTKTEVQKKYKLTQRELTLYEGYNNWSDRQKADHKKILEYKRLHPNASIKEAIEKGCEKAAVGYRFALAPTQEQQDEYNKKFAEKVSPKAVIKGTDIKSLILSDSEKEEQDQLYAKIKEVAAARNISPRDATSLLKSRMVKDYGIVIEQIKKDLMMKYRVNRGEGKAPNTLEAIVMSEYLPIAKCILDDMLTESFAVR